MRQPQRCDQNFEAQLHLQFIEYDSRILTNNNALTHFDKKYAQEYIPDLFSFLSILISVLLCDHGLAENEEEFNELKISKR